MQQQEDIHRRKERLHGYSMLLLLQQAVDSRLQNMETELFLQRVAPQTSLKILELKLWLSRKKQQILFRRLALDF